MANKKQTDTPKDHERQFEQVLKRLLQTPEEPAAKKPPPKRKKQARTRRKLVTR